MPAVSCICFQDSRMMSLNVLSPSVVEGVGPGSGLSSQRGPDAATLPPQSPAGATAGNHSAGDMGHGWHGMPGSPHPNDSPCFPVALFPSV